MTIRLQEVVRSEVEGGLSGPANPIPSESIDCGCGQLPCPKLARFATRGLFVGLMSWIGLVQAAAFAYFNIAGPTITRRFQFDPYLMDWLLMVSGLTPFALGLVIAYWGNRIHRAAWIGGLVLLQSVSYFILIIPHLTHRVRVIEEVANLTHMSLYSDDSPEMCSAGSSRLVIEEEEPCYFSLAVIIAVQVITGMANVAYFALGISYLDDNTKKRHVAAFIGIVLAVKLLGILLGYVLAWGCLRIDAETLLAVDSYKDQIGAWWLGFPILAVLLVIPGLLLSWFPRRLPSEVVEQAAASLLNTASRYDRTPRGPGPRKLQVDGFFRSLARLFANKILLCNVFASVLCATALINYSAYENAILESRFHVPRPTGMLLGFGDPMYSRLASSILKPVLIGLIVIVSGLVIAKGRPSARYLAGYGVVMIVLTGTIVFSMIFASCYKKPIKFMETKNSIMLLQYCNKNCGCSNDADFRPVCDTAGSQTFYSPCHAGCTSWDTADGIGKYRGCSCVEGSRNAVDGPCGSSQCQMGWLVFEFGTMFAYALTASTFVGDLVINLRSVSGRDKAVAIGFWMTWLALFVNVPGRLVYEQIANLTCLYWGSQRSFCHLHENGKLGDYLSYLTAGLLVACALVKTVVWVLCKDLKLYVQTPESEGATEMRAMAEVATPTGQTAPTSNNNNNNADGTTEVEVIVEPTREPTTSEPNLDPGRAEDTRQAQVEPLKYGPLGPGDRRTDPKTGSRDPSRSRATIRNLDSEDELSSSDEESRKGSSPKVAYKPLDIDSDVESDLSTAEPRSRKRIHSREYDRVPVDDALESERQARSPSRRFPNPDDYGDPRQARQNGYLDGSSKTSSFEFSKKDRRQGETPKGDFNEVGIPIVEPPVIRPTSGNPRFLKDVRSLIDRFEQNADKSEPEVGPEPRLVSGIPLVAMVHKKGSPLRGQSPSGASNNSSSSAFADARSESRGSNSSRNSARTGRGSLCTDL